MAKQDLHQEAKERYDDAKENMRENYERMREDLRFSNPADPKQWDGKALELRKGRPCLTFDRTNQFIAQVVNEARQNAPAIHTILSDSNGNEDVATALDGMIRHIEYQSRAAIAYDWSLECAARIGIGWIRVIPEIMRPETNEQEIRILRVTDPLSCVLDPNSTHPDGSDAMFGFAETMMSMRAFKAAYPKASTTSWDGQGGSWFKDDFVKIAEYLYVQETTQNRISVPHPDGGSVFHMSEDEYHAASQAAGFQLPVHGTFQASMRTVKWAKMSGVEVLEETDFPSQFLPLIPVIGHELWIDGKRYLCGMTRRLMDSQKAYNYERSAFIESVAMQPKAPIMAPIESIEGHENVWSGLNAGNPAVLPFNAFDEEGRPLPAPNRLAPPAFPVAFAQGGQIASQDMEAAIGMYKANLGQQDNANSGIAIQRRKVEGDMANFHYPDNQARSVEQVGRVVVDMIPRIYDTARRARILNIDGTHDFVDVDPEMPQAAKKEGKKTVAINPGVGAYSVRVKVGPAFSTLKEEAAQSITDLTQGNPQLGAALAPLLVKMHDMPDADKISKVCMALLPPEVQKAYADEDGQGEPEIPPQIQQQIKQLQQQNQQMAEALQNAQKELEGHELKKVELISKQEMAERTDNISAYEAETARLKVLLDAGLIPNPAATASIQSQLIQDTQATDITDQDEGGEQAEPPPDPSQQEPQQAPTGAFSLPEQTQALPEGQQ